MTDLLAELARSAAGDVPLKWVEPLALVVDPRSERAAVLLAYNTLDAPALSQAFFARTEGEWEFYGEVEGLGPGEYSYGDERFPYLSGTAPAGARFVTVEWEGHRVESETGRGHFLAVFWAAQLREGEHSSAASDDPEAVRPPVSWESSLRLGGTASADDEPVLRLVSFR